MKSEAIKMLDTEYVATKRKLISGALLGGLALAVSLGSVATADQNGHWVVLSGAAFGGLALAARSLVKLVRISRLRKDRER
jgi:hypothetical protein